MQSTIKHLLLLLALIAGIKSYGQKISGSVIDRNTRLLVSGALVNIHWLKTYTNIKGGFEINSTGFNDTLKVSHSVYKAYSILLTKEGINAKIELEPAEISLNEVLIHSYRESDFKRDSIANRIAYVKQFNYSGPKVMDGFKGSTNKQPGDLISINPLILIAALTKKNAPEYKFNKILIRDEQAEYVERKFNRGSIAKITGLMGDTLNAFLTNYKPSYQFALKATDYDIEIYIKDSFNTFKKAGMPVISPFIKVE